MLFPNGDQSSADADAVVRARAEVNQVDDDAADGIKPILGRGAFASQGNAFGAQAEHDVGADREITLALGQ